MLRFGFWLVCLGVAILFLSQWRKELDTQRQVCQRLSGNKVWITGKGLVPADGRWRVYEPEALIPLRSHLQGTLLYSGPVRSTASRFVIQGSFHCTVDPKNPSQVADGLVFLASPRASVQSRKMPQAIGPACARMRAREWMERRLNQWLARHPGLRGLAFAVWLGDARWLPVGWLDLYREGGLLHLLALSGQHVGSLYLVATSILRGFAIFAIRRAWARSFFSWMAAWIPLAGAAYLTALNPGNEPIMRTTLMVLAATWVRGRGAVVPLLQVGTTSIALEILWAPQKIASLSFFLSGAGTLILLLLLKATKGWRRGSAFAIFSLALPLLMTPVTAFCFGKIAWMASVNNLVFGWVWALIWVPLGFVLLPLGLLASCASLRFILDGLEWIWAGFAWIQSGVAPWMSMGFVSSVRPTWFELFLWEALLVAVLFWLCNAVGRNAGARS